VKPRKGVIMVFGEFNNNINSYGLIFGDLKYFDWFKTGRHFEDNKKRRFRNVLIWKGLIYYVKNGKVKEKIWKDFQNGQIDKYPIVTQAFLKHLSCPIQFPILDKHVWRAMRDLRPEISERVPISPEKNDFDFDEHYLKIYGTFFNKLRNKKNGINYTQIDDVDDEIVKGRILDRALWLYGKILNNNQ